MVFFWNDEVFCFEEIVRVGGLRGDFCVVWEVEG